MKSSEIFNKLSHKGSYILIAIFLIITGGINLFGYYHLPDKVATKISLSGEMRQYVPTPIYLIAVFALVLLISLAYLNSHSDRKFKWLFADIIIVIANAIMIVVQS